MLCVFDIETVPDIGIIQKNFTDLEELSEIEICQKAMTDQKEKSGSDFLPIYLHRIVSISSVIADEYGHFIKVGNFGKANNLNTEDTEKSIIEDFLKFINKSQPKLVSFNGRGFDLPTIMLRAMKYNLSAHGYYEQDNSAFNKTKWENYRQRFSERFHTDLLDSLGHFGMIRNLKLDNICSMLNIPGKYDMSGNQVYKIFYDKEMELQTRIAKIDEYCQSDVLNTYWLYLKYELLKGEMILGDYFSILDGFAHKIPKDMGYTDVFINAIKEELKNA
ncbi:3'-5' exonuclease [Helicobacter cappadocius]|uniref:3'-5' exonuclease n=1 Tax=Helicobacter cappadocius TaxID=3063998 RepID=A0AA90PS01_9HELI|nr:MULTISPECIES: 3'-5' exonuclease [unclassified Helicobacter]MDO7252973.1 3'-5' exonuclease [Helicobacter sp. faydin-H75]MDP2539037.1 3'-5' exonuclease [Helicobacter sp. faydin-H76]